MAQRIIITNLKEFAGWMGMETPELVLLLEDYPDLNFWKRRKRVSKYRTLIHSDVEKLRDLLPMEKRKELFL